ncbi:hypothetical protein HrrHm2_070 [Halorubrum virus Humcor2]|nr:hypothetical protein HrrHm2_070 [Halorubrum virus Humcor2]
MIARQPAASLRFTFSFTPRTRISAFISHHVGVR